MLFIRRESKNCFAIFLWLPIDHRLPQVGLHIARFHLPDNVLVEGEKCIHITKGAFLIL